MINHFFGQQKKLHIFDLDDTLIQTRKAYFAAYQQLLEKHFDLPHEQANETIYSLLELFSSGKPAAVFQSYGLLTKNALTPQKLQQLEKDFFTLYWQKLTVFAQVFSYLERLIKQGCVLAIVSNGDPATQQKKLNYCKLSAYFAPKLIYISGSYPEQAKKPAPFLLEQLVQQNTFSIEESVYYGNCTSDALAAKGAGMDFCFFQSPLFLTDRWLNTLFPTLKTWAESGSSK